MNQSLTVTASGNSDAISTQPSDDSEPTALDMVDEPAADFRMFLPVVIRW